MKRSLPLLIITLVFSYCSTTVEDKLQADLIIYGGTIHTVDKDNPSAEAVAVSGDTIIYVGPLSGAEQYKSDKTRMIDLKDRVMTPGIIEGHGHFIGMGQSKQQVELLGTRSYGELIEKVEKAIENADEGEWITGRGWHQSKWKIPSRR